MCKTVYREALKASLALLLCAVAGSAAQALDAADFPAALVCTMPSGDQIYGYLTIVKKDGTALYATPSGGLFGNVTADGTVVAPEIRVAGNCAGRTVSALRAAGQTRDFAR